eukprot:TRINITY_DN12876_c0_g1_i1.p1 TRINITY_DN12876_c0_g1~~TRINITY_DN12876_c0_g1_i1.p1  ORF type:complete len:272 (-),score=5.64 TRINITY_DN12876_c0_g1_i1:157-972(-)
MHPLRAASALISLLVLLYQPLQVELTLLCLVLAGLFHGVGVLLDKWFHFTGWRRVRSILFMTAGTVTSFLEACGKYTCNPLFVLHETPEWYIHGAATATSTPFQFMWCITVLDFFTDSLLPSESDKDCTMWWIHHLVCATFSAIGLQTLANTLGCVWVNACSIGWYLSYLLLAHTKQHQVGRVVFYIGALLQLVVRIGIVGFQGSYVGMKMFYFGHKYWYLAPVLALGSAKVHYDLLVYLIGTLRRLHNNKNHKKTPQFQIPSVTSSCATR